MAGLLCKQVAGLSCKSVTYLMQIHRQTHFNALARHMLTYYQISSILTCQHMEPSYNDLESLELGQSTYVPRYKTAAGDGKPACTVTLKVNSES